MVLLLAGALRELAAEEVVDIRPVWMPLEGLGGAGASVEEVFRSGEVVQMYHLQVRACGAARWAHASAAKRRCWTGCVVFREYWIPKFQLSYTDNILGGRVACWVKVFFETAVS